jgi:hypothetical protein
MIFFLVITLSLTKYTYFQAEITRNIPPNGLPYLRRDGGGEAVQPEK